MFDEYHQHFEKIGFTKADWDRLTFIIQGIYKDIASIKKWDDDKWIKRWLDNTGSGIKRSDAIKEIQEEYEKNIL